MSQHNAPPVNYPLGRSRLLALLLSLAWCAAAGVTVAWWRSAAVGDFWPAWGLATLGVAGVALFISWRRSPTGHLRWNSRRWSWQSAAYPNRADVSAPEVALDLQWAMLLRLRQASGPAWWLWTERGSAPAYWLDLRRAVYAPTRRTQSLSSDSDSFQP